MRRDLVAELGAALSPHGIRLIAYLAVLAAIGASVNPTRGQSDRAPTPAPWPEVVFVRSPEPGRPGLAQLRLTNRHAQPAVGRIHLSPRQRAVAQPVLRILAELRLARCSGDLAVHLCALEAEPVRTEHLWDGSCLELYAAVGDGPGRQLILVPASGALPPRAVLVESRRHADSVLHPASGSKKWPSENA